VDTDGLKSLGEATATIRFGLATWAGLGLTLNSFIGVEGIGLTVGPTSDAVDLLDVPSPVGFSADDPQAHPLNPAGVAYADPSRRTARATDFRYDATDPATFIATATGQMGFAGVSRWTVSPDRGGGQLLFGDYNLFYNGATSTWELVNRIDFPLTTFTLGNAQVTTAPGHRFTITGDLIGAVALGILLGDALGVDFGDIRIEGRCVPEATDPS